MVQRFWIASYTFHCFSFRFIFHFSLIGCEVWTENIWTNRKCFVSLPLSDNYVLNVFNKELYRKILVIKQTKNYFYKKQWTNATQNQDLLTTASHQFHTLYIKTQRTSRLKLHTLQKIAFFVTSYERRLCAKNFFSIGSPCGNLSLHD